MHCRDLGGRIERQGGRKFILKEMIAENFPNQGKETEIQIQEAQKSPYKIKPTMSTPRHIVIQMAKVVIKRIFKAAKENKTVTYRGN